MSSNIPVPAKFLWMIPGSGRIVFRFLKAGSPDFVIQRRFASFKAFLPAHLPGMAHPGTTVLQILSVPWNIGSWGQKCI
jgi:hypothetical protein